MGTRLGQGHLRAALTMYDQHIYPIHKAMAIFELLADVWGFLNERKKFWLLPLTVPLVLLGGLVVLTQGSALAPFIYTLF